MELLRAATEVATEKKIDKEKVIIAMEQAIQKAARSKYGHEYDIRAEINRKTGMINIFRFREVVEELLDPATQIPLEEAKHVQKDIKPGEFIQEPLPPLDFGRMAAQTARQVIIQTIRSAEKERQYEDFVERQGEIVNGIVKRVEFGNATVDLGAAEALLRRDESLPREKLKAGDRVRAYIKEVRRETKGPQIFISRTDPMFMVKLFAQEVPEIYDGIIEIKSVARDPGSRAKIAVVSNDPSIDPVGACVGMRGNRVQAIVNELQGEKIDIVPYSEDIGTFISNALAPAEVSKIVVDETNGRIEVVVATDQLSLAIGRRGQNVRLASSLAGWELDILSESEESEKRAEEFKQKSQTFIAALDVDDVISHLLVAEGFNNIEEIAHIDISELANIEGFDEDVAKELQNRALTYLAKEEKEIEDEMKKLKIKPELATYEGLSKKQIIALGKNDVKTLNDLADLAADELCEILNDPKFTLEEANKIIMSLRESWFENEEEDKTE